MARQRKEGKRSKVSVKFNDHVTGRFILGYKVLVCGYWDDGSFIPIDFSLHRERGDELDKARGKRNCARRKAKQAEAATKSIGSIFDLLSSQAQEENIIWCLLEIFWEIINGIGEISKIDCIELFEEMILDNQRAEEMMRLFSPVLEKRSAT